MAAIFRHEEGTVLKTTGKYFVILALGATLGATAAYTAEPHPAIHAAQKDLELAKRTLEHADHDFAGHRVKAIQQIDGALVELRLALEADKQ
jgi:hypothetical protein